MNSQTEASISIYSKSMAGYALKIHSEKQKCQSLNRAQLFATPWTVAGQAHLSMEFSRQEHRYGLPFTSPGDLPNPGIEPGSPALQADSLLSEPHKYMDLVHH